MRVLILNGDLPVFPGRAGHEFLQTTRLAGLVDKLGLVSMVHTGEQARKKEALAEAGVELHLWEGPCVGESVPLARRPLGWRGAPRRLGKKAYQLARSSFRRPVDTVDQDLQFRNMAGPLLQALRASRWDVLVVVQSQCARWIDYLPPVPLSVLVLHDVRALVMERQGQLTSGAQKAWSRLQGGLYRQLESEYCRKYDLVVTVSKADEAFVREYYRPHQVVTVPIPVDADYFAPVKDLPEAPARIVFTGMMDHGPNVDAACYFALDVLGRVQRLRPDAEFWIVGRDPAPEVRRLASIPGVVVTGFVPDIRSHLAQATVCVVPLRFGAGMRNKIIEAWGLEKCVVSTTIGAEGLDHRHGENILIADDAAGMAEAVLSCLGDGNLRNRLRGAGRRVIVEQHDPDVLAARYRDTIAAALEEKRSASRPLRVAIDLRWMRPGEAGGIENLSRSFLQTLLELDRHNNFQALVPAGVQFDFDLRGRDNFRVAAADGLEHQMEQALWRWARFAHRWANVDYWRTPEVEALRFGHSLGADVVLSMSGYISTDMSVMRNLLVVHDLQHEYHPEFFTPEVLEERRRVFGGSILQADHLLAVSEHTRQTVMEIFGVSPERITTVHEAADPIFHPERRGHIDRRAVLAKYGLPEGAYLFFPAHTWPHKNHRGALEALALLRDDHGLDCELVCTGTPKEAHGEIRELACRLGLAARLRFLGYTPLDDMPALYEGAACLVYPSYFEGFGIPLLEAMWCDCPIVCSDRTSLPEVAGDAALLANPARSDEIADALRKVLVDGDLRNELVARGRKRVRRFTWQHFASEVVRLLHVAARA